MISFTPNLKLHMDDTAEKELASFGKTAEDLITELVTFFKEQNLANGVTFTGKVVFLEDGSTGEFSGVVVATFTRNDIFHLKTTSGDIIALTFE